MESSSSSSSSIVSKARTAFHSAAAKAERVLTDIKSDLKSDRAKEERVLTDIKFDSKSDREKQSEPESPKNDAKLKLRWRPAPIKTKQDWHEKLRNIGIGKKGGEDIEKAEDSTMAVPFFDENVYRMHLVNDSEESEAVSSEERSFSTHIDIIPPASTLKQLAIAVEAGKRFKSMKDLLASARSSSPVRERASLSLSAVKSLVLREKEDKQTSEFANDEEVLSSIHLLFNTEGHYPRRKIELGSMTPGTLTSLPREIHGAPPESFIVELSEIIGTFKTLRKMALFWRGVVSELRRLWYEGQHVPGVPEDEIPDLKSCLLYQQLQVINCCVSRKRRRSIASESLDSVIREANSNGEESDVTEDTVPSRPILYARVGTGELVLRLGADHPSDNLAMLETGEPVYFPIMQDGPLLTEDLIKETEEFVLRTGSVGAGCSQLLSDMQAFKAANPGCTLEDFVRWHSPPDWMEREPSDEAKEAYDGCDPSRGQLSSRMQKEGNLWRELWETAKPIPAVRQTPLFDEDFAVEGILNGFEDIPPLELFEQLFVSLLGLGFVIAEATLSTNSDLSKLFYECKEYMVVTFQGSFWSEKVDDLCQVYETVETMILQPDGVLKAMKQNEDTPNAAGEPKRRFKRLSLNFGGKDKLLKKPPSEDNPMRQSFSSLFSKKPPKPAEKPPCPDESEWTIV